MNWLLIVVLGIFVGLTYMGYRKGLIMTAFSIGSVIISLVLTSILTPIIGTSVRNNPSVYNAVNQKMQEIVNLEQVDDATNEAQYAAIDELGLPNSIKKILKDNNNVEVYKERAVTSFKEYIADYLTRIAINAIVYVLVYMVVRIAVMVAARMLNVISRLPMVYQFDKVGGALVGFAKGLLIVWLVFVVVTMLASSQLGQSALTCIAKSPFLNFVYKSNLILMVVTGFIK